MIFPSMTAVSMRGPRIGGSRAAGIDGRSDAVHRHGTATWFLTTPGRGYQASRHPGGVSCNGYRRFILTVSQGGRG